jgi:DNA-binding NtrC family response regulator
MVDASFSSVSHVLVLDDDRSIRRTLEKFLSGEGYEVTTTGDGEEAVAKAPAADLLLLDLGLPTRDGLDVLAEVTRLDGAPCVIVITARDDMRSTVRAIQLGAYDYLVKPLDIERLRLTIRRALESREASRALRQLFADTTRAYEVGSIVGQSQAIRELYKTIGAVSTSRASVLILGESGTGKELVARAIHHSSPDRERPFIAINCTAFARDLLESELFGHARGAFTGAVADKAGRFELAGSGTLFLDEIAEIPVDLQAKLLRVLQERTFERVGDHRPIRLGARVIAATHRDLAAMIAHGAFREDLYYRLRVVEVMIPPLRERREDIPLIARALVAKINQELHKNVRYISAEAMALLQRYSFPGNVRELENALTRAIVLAKSDVIEPDLLPIEPRKGGPVSRAPVEPGDEALLPLREVERRHVERVLHATSWNKRRACSILDISRPTLDRKLEEYGLSRPEE